MKIVFIGSNPSCTSPINDPFSHCRSANKMLNDWIPALGLTRDQVEFMNVANYKTPGNRPLRMSEIKAELPRLMELLRGRIVVTLGNTASTAVSLVKRYEPNVDVVANLPHPSGLNRQLNDKVAIANLISRTRVYIADAIRKRSVQDLPQGFITDDSQT